MIDKALWVSPEFHRRVKVLAAQQGLSMREVLSDALDLYVVTVQEASDGE